MNKKLILIGLLCLLGYGCHHNRPYYSKKVRDWQSQFPKIEGELSYEVFLFGDGGEPPENGHHNNLVLLQRELEKAGSNSAVVFLGDNIYPAGMPEEGAPDRAEAEQALNGQLDMLRNFKGRPFFIPGNHDWNRWSPGGRESVIRQQKYIEKYLGNSDVMYPGKACGDPKAIELTDDLTLIMIDTQWWLQDWDGEENMNKGCKADTREEYERMLAEMTDEYDDGNILMVGHHPLYTNGSHGGFFPIEEHIFPLTYLQKNLYIPLPFIGSLHPVLRYLGATSQDITNEKNQDMRQDILDAIFRINDLVYASGHEHALEYFYYEKENQHFIVSGSGSKGSFTKSENDENREIEAEFLYQKQGFSKILYMKDGSAYLEFWSPNEDGSEGKLLFRKVLRDRKFSVTDPVLQEDPYAPEPTPDSIEVFATRNYAAGKSKRKFLGEQYRDAWEASVTWPVLDMSIRYGGLYPIKRGGGMQTKTLRLASAQGHEYALRSALKEARPILPEFMANTGLEDIIQDQYSMDHPYGALIVPKLADAAGVYHANPMYYWVPKQQNLGEFSEEFGDKLYLLEERPAKNREDVASFGNSKKIVSYRKMLSATRENQDHRIDQQHALRSRIFDILIGDWDRHDDQWRWATFKEDDLTIYRPIPRDRDHAFLAFRGYLPWLVSRKWGARQLRSFEHKITDVVGLSFNARNFDRAYLNDMDREDFRLAAMEIQENMTDAVIEEAIHSWPDTLFKLNGPEIISKLKSRRESLPEVMDEYYRFLAKEVDVIGTDKRELFEVSRMDNGETRVQVFDVKKDGEKKDLLYDRTFSNKETREVRLYGLKGDDTFNISGEAGSGLLVRVIGGQGDDKIVDESKISGIRKRTKVYDTRTGTSLQLGKEAKDLTLNHREINEYDRLSYKYPQTLPLIVAGFNPDDGVLLGGGVLFTRQGFRKDPFKSRQSVSANVALSTGAVKVQYAGEFVRVVGKWDVGLNAHFYNASHVINFFGLGNLTQYDDSLNENRDYNRQKYGQLLVQPFFQRTLNNREQKFRIGMGYERTSPVRITGRVSDSENDEMSGLTDYDFEVKDYGRVFTGYYIEKVDNKMKPSRGLVFNFDASWNVNIDSTERNFVRLASDLAFYYTFTKIRTTYATNFGGAVNFGTYEFYQANFLGRRNNLRGFRGERFGGDATFFWDNDLRIDLFRIKGAVVPGMVGILGFFDVGRVWYSEEAKNGQWHNGYGGGVYWHLYDTFLLNFTYTLSKESNFVEFGLKYFF